MIPDFKTYLKESVWSDIHRRSNGTQERKEDDVNKRNVAKENKLNYLEVFTTDIEKCKDIINTYISKL